jgi:hypothetical protein
MIYFLILLVLTVLALKYINQGHKMHLVHAATPKILPSDAVTKDYWPISRMAVGADGKFMNLTGKFIGFADGNSGVRFGIPHGQRFVADYLDETSKKELHKGDLVVVEESPLDKSEHSYGLRMIKEVNNTDAHFFKDYKGVPHENLELSKILAKVSYVASP